jgi:FMN phosphatase YigB (HAD superfamily)
MRKLLKNKIDKLFKSATVDEEAENAKNENCEESIVECVDPHDENLKLAKRMNLFDYDWYQKRYGTFSSELEAFHDYCHKSIFSNVNPSANFDTEGYHKHHLDIYHQCESPLLHYIHHGADEGRTKLNEIIRWTPKTTLSTTNDEGWESQNVAVCIHIFYEDFIERFVNSLAYMPFEVDLYLSVSEGIELRLVEEAFEKHSKVKTLKCVSVPNRGRNFGPMLVEFGSDLLNYELVCHLHSKKSLYSGRDQTQWFDYLNQFLLQDRNVVREVLKLFHENSDLGIYYPTTFQMMPAWVNHWTCNKPFASSFVSDWDLDISENFLTYPVGGMFWARPMAIRQMLESNYEYDHFPAEPLPNDGSWLHALERALGLLVEKNDYKQFYFYPPLGCFTTDNSFKFIDYFKPPIQLQRELRNFEVVSFDIFDTLIRRQYTEPDYAKYLVGKTLFASGMVSSASVFIKNRNSAELQLRKEQNFQGDVSIVQIYERLGEMLDVDKEYARELMELEFQFDLNMICAKDEMIHIVQQLSSLGRTIWLISDTYYTEEQIELMLKKVGLSMPYTLFLSSVLNKRKDTGTMWQYVQELVTTKGVSYLHVGDNVRSDSQLCGDYGLSNMHILHPLDKWQAAGLPGRLTPKNGTLNEKQVLKWGRMISNHGRYPFNGD